MGELLLDYFEGRGELAPSLGHSKSFQGCKYKKKHPILCLKILSCAPLLANLGPLIANMNLEFANFIMRGK